MLRWTITFLVIALVAALFGFGGIAAGAAWNCKSIVLYLSRVVCAITGIWCEHLQTMMGTVKNPDP